MGANSLVAYARRMLRASVEHLTPSVALKLKKARIKALEQARRR